MNKWEASPESSNEALGEEFKKKLENRVEETLQRLVDNRFEDYFEKRIPKENLEQASDRVFSMILQGKSKEQALQEIKALSAEIVDGRFRN